jgi:hypothetical protein
MRSVGEDREESGERTEASIPVGDADEPARPQEAIRASSSGPPASARFRAADALRARRQRLPAAAALASSARAPARMPNIP